MRPRRCRMIRCPSPERFLVLALVLLESSVSGVAADSVLLQPKFDGSNDAYVELSTDALQTMPGPDGKPMEIQARSIYGLLMKATPKGSSVELNTTIDRLFGFL